MKSTSNAQISTIWDISDIYFEDSYIMSNLTPHLTIRRREYCATDFYHHAIAGSRKWSIYAPSMHTLVVNGVPPLVWRCPSAHHDARRLHRISSGTPAASGVYQASCSRTAIATGDNTQRAISLSLLIACSDLTGPSMVVGRPRCE